MVKNVMHFVIGLYTDLENNILTSKYKGIDNLNILESL